MSATSARIDSVKIMSCLHCFEWCVECLKCLVFPPLYFYFLLYIYIYIGLSPNSENCGGWKLGTLGTLGTISYQITLVVHFGLKIKRAGGHLFADRDKPPECRAPDFPCVGDLELDRLAVGLDREDAPPLFR